MLDVKFIRENAQLVENAAKAKGINMSIRDLLCIDEERMRLLRAVEELRHGRNEVSEEVAIMMRRGLTQRAEAAKQKARDVNAELAQVEHEYAKIKARFDEQMMLVPNIVSPDTPDGASDADNVELKRVGELPDFDFLAQDHMEIADRLQLVDVTRGVKVAGSRGYFLKNAGLFLHRAVQQLAVDLLAKRGFTIMDVPLLVQESALVNTGFFPTGRDQTYHVDGDDAWLVGTSEVPLVSYYANEVVDVSTPIRLAAVSNCFRREAGSAGRDVRGLYRVHQFAKVEQVVICRADLETSHRLFEEITGYAEEILTLLELPYRVVAVCTGDLSQKNYKQVDIETWMPSRGGYGETHSSSMLLDFQAQRSNIRYRDDDGALRHCHTLNNTAVASPRILIPLLENHQQADGSVRIPGALRKYLGGMERLA